MLRTVVVVALVALLGLVATRLVFGLLGPLFGLLLWVARVVVQLLLMAAVGYLVLRLVSPATAARVLARVRRTASAYW